MRELCETFMTAGVGVEVRNPGPDIVQGALRIEASGLLKLIYFVIGPFDVRAFLLNEHVPPGLCCTVRLEGPCLGWIIETLAGVLRERPLRRVGAESPGC